MLGCHGLVWTGTFDEAGVDLAVGKSLDAGFDLLEIPMFDPFGFDVAAAKRSIARRPISVTTSLGLTAGTDITSEDGEVVEAGVRMLGRVLENLSELESGYLVGCVYSQLAKYPGPASELSRRNSIEALRRVAERGQELGVHVGLEVVNRYETNLFNTAKGALAYIDEVDHPNIGVHLDTYHMNIEESDLFLPVLLCGDRLSYVHIGESHRGYLGTGTVDFDTFFRALAHIGYTGPITFESFSTAVVSPELSNTLAIWRNLWRDGDDLARHASDFIRSKQRSVETLALH
jgi:D-psicose/D-tagatose/L-ribulose 3-epimerase